jgi:hypothetical protein
MDDVSKSYQVLGLKPGATPEEARQTYRDLVNVWHPDRFSHDERLRLVAQEKLKEINGAYEVVKAGFFDAGNRAVNVEGGEPPASVEPPEPVARRGNRAALWTVSGLVLLALIGTAAFLVLKKPQTESSTARTTSSPRPVHALSFDRNGHVEIATSGSLTGTFTVECWVLNRSGQVGTIIGSRAPKDFGFNIKFRQGKRFHSDIGDGSRWLLTMANAPFRYQRHTWYHLVYVVTPAAYTVYVNGALVEDSPFPSGNPVLYDVDHRLFLGSDGHDAEDLDGSIAELRIWKTARSAEQIKANMGITLKGNEPGLMGYWRFSEGSGTETADSSGRGFKGTLVGIVSWSVEGPSLVPTN